ncbi:MAG: 2-oxo-4-hydroxy-4-carboxy-5-ureidoimidazoline decarboxylase [Hyphomicrobiales bacterium]
MTDSSEKFTSSLPSTMNRADFVARFGGVYEHSPWIAEAVFDAGLTPAEDSAAGLSAAMMGVLKRAGDDKKLALIRAHPDLAGKAALAGELTDESASEQAGAALDQCTPKEFAAFRELNAAYGEKFGFPFIIAVKGKTRHDILDAFRGRLKNDAELELETALAQINKIARFRLDAL